MDAEKLIEKKLSIKSGQAKAVIELLREGNTVPFIARYRKEMTGGLSDEEIEKIEEWAKRWQAIEDRRKTILKSLDEQEIKDAGLRKQIAAAETMVDLEDLYAPFKPKRKTKASVAKEKGLEGLAALILGQKASEKRSAVTAFAQKVSGGEEEAIAGAKDIIAEKISDEPKLKAKMRDLMTAQGGGSCKKKRGAEDEKGTYADYYDFAIPIQKMKPHQILAIHRAEDEKVLAFSVNLPLEEWRKVILQVFPVNAKSAFYLEMLDAIEEAGDKYLLPSLEREIKASLFEQAEDHAIEVFSRNLENLLLTSPLKDETILAIDPGYRNGCKLAVIDRTGKVLDTGVIYPHEPQKDVVGAARALSEMIREFKVRVIAVGNGTASKETETFLINLLKIFPDTKYTVVNEAGASVYSASPLARKEFPDMDVNLRSAVSIARRLQDPLAEMVKIDPKSIGVGMYQHDVDQKKLSEALEKVVVRVVNRVGVDVNTASPALLTFVAGIGEKLANNIMSYREANGPFKNRKELKKVAGMGERSFEQSAGFLRVYGGSEPLDTTAIHPESYKAAKEILKLAKIKLEMSPTEKEKGVARMKREFPAKELASLLGVGQPTVEMILSEIVHPGSDPRAGRSKVQLRSKLMDMADLKPGMELTGTVRNVTDFGLFVDIGVKQDALLHKSKLAEGTTPKVGDVIPVVVENVDTDRGRIGIRLG
jgi:protein Tex